MIRGVVLLTVALSAVLGAQSPIVIDGRLGDWPSSDDAVVVRISEDYLLIRWRFPGPTILSDVADRRLRVQTSTGVLEWRFDTGRGELKAEGADPQTLDYLAAGVVAQPSFASDTFELALDRRGRLRPLLAAGAVSVIDCRVAAENGCAALARATAVLPAGSPADERITLPSRPSSATRVLSLNAESNALTDPARVGAMTRLLQAMRPDVVVFQELYDVEAPATVDVLNRALPPSTWQAEKRGLDLVVAARGPVGATLVHRFTDWGSVAAFEVPARSTTSRRLHILNAHLPCCRPPGVEARRTEQLRAAARHVATLRAADPTAPVLIAGDLNLVGHDAILEELVHGGIAGGPLTDVAPTVPGSPLSVTWRVTGSRFSPGRLDYLLVNPLGFRDVSAFLLDTARLPATTLAAAGLARDDSATASDHLAIVADLVLR